MLDTLRKGASGWIAQIFIALLVVSFAIWGVSDIFSGFRSDTVASVGRTDVSAQSFAREYDMARRQLSQQLRQPVTAEQAQMFGLPGQVLGRLVAQATLMDEAHSLGLGVSSQTLARQIADDPNFQGSGGLFDRAAFNAILQQNGLTEDQYLEQLRETYVRQQLIDALAGATEVPEAYLRALHEFRSEERNLAYLVLTPALVPDVGQPSDADLNAFFEANKADWKAPELRALRIMRMAPEDLADTGGIDEAEARKVYDSELATRFTTTERRKIQQIVFKDKADAEQAAAALSSGKTFDDLIAQRNLTAADVDLGLMTKDAIIDKAVADPAFGLAPGAVSGVIDGRFGPVIVRVTTVEPSVVTSFDEAKPALLKELAERRAAAEIADQHDVIEDSRAGGATLEEIAGKYGLKVMTIAAVDSTGKDANGVAIADIPGGNQLVAAAFDSDVGIENDPIRLQPSGYAWYEVTAVTAARDRQLSEVRDQVVAAWKKAEVDKQLTARAEGIRDRLAAGEDIAKVAIDNALTFQSADKVTRSTPASGDLTSAAIQAAFGGPKGYAAVAPGAADGAKTIVVVTAVNVPPYVGTSPEIGEAKTQLSQQMTSDLLQQYIAQLQARLGVGINQAAVQAVIGALPGV